MGLLVFVRNLLLALCLFLVLGFLYYSAWKLHLLQWEDSSKYSHSSSPQENLLQYDRLGFLLKLDSKLPAELATKYANFSEGACKPGYASALMTAIFPRLQVSSYICTNQYLAKERAFADLQNFFCCSLFYSILFHEVFDLPKLCSVSSTQKGH
uniref:CMP-N-acetylneuraminate-beta-1,4-galactoside alpha-2,3-sialyltransferase n=1 Tax=Castor canadensis TaxID=51338 RepID=A0A8C0WSK4_CASCN